MLALALLVGQHPQYIQLSEDPMQRVAQLKNVIGGNIALSYPFNDAVGMVSNEEAEEWLFPLNRQLLEDDMDTCLYGNGVLVGISDGVIESLSEEQAFQYHQDLYYPQQIVDDQVVSYSPPSPGISR